MWTHSVMTLSQVIFFDIFFENYRVEIITHLSKYQYCTFPLIHFAPTPASFYRPRTCYDPTDLGKRKHPSNHKHFIPCRTPYVKYSLRWHCHIVQVVKPLLKCSRCYYYYLFQLHIFKPGHFRNLWTPFNNLPVGSVVAGHKLIPIYCGKERGIFSLSNILKRGKPHGYYMQSLWKLLWGGCVCAHVLDKALFDFKDKIQYS